MSFKDLLNQPLPSKSFYYNISDESVVNEDAISYKKLKPKSLGQADFCVFGGEGRYPHFHLIWGNRKHPEQTCCIRFDKNIYFFHPEHEHTDRSIDSGKERAELIEILNRKHTVKDIPSEYDTVWKLLIWWWNKYAKDSREMVQLPIDLPIPDYMNLHVAIDSDEKSVNIKLLER